MSLQSLRAVGVAPVKLTPINSNKDLDQNGALNADMRIKICDGSLLPIAPWGNPQAVIMVLNEILMDRWINKLYEE